MTWINGLVFLGETGWRPMIFMGTSMLSVEDFPNKKQSIDWMISFLYHYFRNWKMDEIVL